MGSPLSNDITFHLETMVEGPRGMNPDEIAAFMATGRLPDVDAYGTDTAVEDSPNDEPGDAGGMTDAEVDAFLGGLGAPLVAADDHWKRQPRDPSGEDAGQWIDSPQVSDLGTRQTWEIDDGARVRLSDAWHPINAKLEEKYGEYGVSRDATPEELTDAVRQTRANAGLTDVSTKDIAALIQQNFNRGGLHQLETRVSRFLDSKTDVDRDGVVRDEPQDVPDSEVPTATPPPADDDPQFTSPPPLEFPTFSYEEGVPPEIFGGDKTPVQQRAINHYTGSSYEEYTMYLRGQRSDIRPGVARSIEHIRDAMAPTPRDATLFRYVDPDAFGPDVTIDNIVERLVPGTEMTDPSFVSTGIDEDMLYLYSRSVLMQIEAPAGTPMVYVGHLTANEDDDGEMILKDGLRYRVVGVWRDSRYQVTVRVRVVP